MRKDLYAAHIMNTSSLNFKSVATSMRFWYSTALILKGMMRDSRPRKSCSHIWEIFAFWMRKNSYPLPASIKQNSWRLSKSSLKTRVSDRIRIIRFSKIPALLCCNTSSFPQSSRRPGNRNWMSRPKEKNVKASGTACISWTYLRLRVKR